MANLSVSNRTVLKSQSTYRDVMAVLVVKEAGSTDEMRFPDKLIDKRPVRFLK